MTHGLTSTFNHATLLILYQHVDDPLLARERSNLAGTNHTQHHDNILTSDLLHKDTTNHHGTTSSQHYDTTGRGFDRGAAGTGLTGGSDGAIGASGSTSDPAGAERTYHPDDYNPTPSKGNVSKVSFNIILPDFLIRSEV